ncbi:MAG TPA: ABC transporter ATP-binding protein [Actinomycetota bacterium]|nr:ABC transporter ATP-binding protein [Actinomycetota bacterium]
MRSANDVAREGLTATVEARPVLEVRGLVRRFGGLRALDGVDLEVRSGEILGIIGPNGAGKSTLFNVVTGLIRPTEGRVYFRGRDITGLAPHEVCRLGVGRKFQVPSCFSGLTVRQNLQVAARGRWPVARLVRAGGDSRERWSDVDDLLDRLGLASKADLEAAALSHGERQWLEIGMVLVNGCQVLLLDEPTAGMTLGETRRTERLLRDLGGAHTVAVIEHDIRFIREVAERVIVLHRGRVLASGTIDAVERDERVRDVYLGRGE